MNVLPLGVLLFFALAVVLLFIVPIWLIVSGSSGLHRLKGRRGAAVKVALGAIWALFVVAFLDSCFGPWHEKILETGVTPDGRDYALIQRRSELFAIELYVRDPVAGWVFHYVEHETGAWRWGGHVEFDGDTAKVFNGGKLDQTVELLPSGDSPDGSRCPATYSAEDLFKELTGRAHLFRRRPLQGTHRSSSRHAEPRGRNSRRERRARTSRGVRGVRGVSFGWRRVPDRTTRRRDDETTRK